MSSGPLRWEQRPALLIGVTATAGWLDALSFLYLGKIFTSFMTGNLLFVGIGAGTDDGGLIGRAAVALAAFLIGSVAGARLTGSRLTADSTHAGMTRTLLLEAVVLGVFAVLWLIVGTPADHELMLHVLIALGALAMGLQVAVALALRLPNMPTVAMTGTIAQLGALLGWKEREGRGVVAETPSAALMIAFILTYLIAAVVVSTIPTTAALAIGPVVLLVVTLLVDRSAPLVDRTAPGAAPSA